MPSPMISDTTGGKVLIHSRAVPQGCVARELKLCCVAGGCGLREHFLVSKKWYTRFPIQPCVTQLHGSLLCVRSRREEMSAARSKQHRGDCAGMHSGSGACTIYAHSAVPFCTCISKQLPAVLFRILHACACRRSGDI